MNRLVPWAIGAAIFAAAGGILASAEQEGVAFIPGHKPVDENQVRQELQSKGWSNVQIVRNGQYFQVVGSQGGRPSQITVDSQTGRPQEGDDGDD